MLHADVRWADCDERRDVRKFHVDRHRLLPLKRLQLEIALAAGLGVRVGNAERAAYFVSLLRCLLKIGGANRPECVCWICGN